MNLRKCLLNRLKKEQDELHKQLSRQIEMIRRLGEVNLQTCLFEVRIFGGSGCHQKIEHRQTGGSLRGAIATAERKFKKLNPPRDVEHFYAVRLIIPDFSRLEIPHELWKNHVSLKHCELDT